MARTSSDALRWRHWSRRATKALAACVAGAGLAARLPRHLAVGRPARSAKGYPLGVLFGAALIPCSPPRAFSACGWSLAAGATIRGSASPPDRRRGKSRRVETDDPQRVSVVGRECVPGGTDPESRGLALASVSERPASHNKPRWRAQARLRVSLAQPAPYADRRRGRPSPPPRHVVADQRRQFAREIEKRGKSAPVSTPISSNMFTRSSVHTLPVAPGATDIRRVHRARIETHRALLDPATALARPMPRVL